MKIFLSFLIFIILLKFILYYENFLISQCPLPKVITYRSGTPKINILVIGGVHGDEPGPTQAIDNFINDYSKQFKNANIYFIPRVNINGLERNWRYLPCKSSVIKPYDINRNFGKDKNNKIINKILEIGSICDYIIDFHEAFGFYKETPNKTLGSTIIPNINKDAINFAHYIVDEVNKNLNLKGFKQFSFYNKTEVKHTHGWYYNYTDKKYILVEITGKLNKQPLQLRQEQSYEILKIIFKKLSII